MQRKRELKFYATNTKKATISADFGCVAAPRGKEGRPRGQICRRKFFFFGGREHTKRSIFSKKFLLKRTEEKNGFCNTVFAVLIQKKALEEEDKEEVRSIDRG